MPHKNYTCCDRNICECGEKEHRTHGSQKVKIDIREATKKIELAFHIEQKYPQLSLIEINRIVAGILKGNVQLLDKKSDIKK